MLYCIDFQHCEAPDFHDSIKINPSYKKEVKKFYIWLYRGWPFYWSKNKIKNNCRRNHHIERCGHFCDGGTTCFAASKMMYSSTSWRAYAADTGEFVLSVWLVHVKQPQAGKKLLQGSEYLQSHYCLHDDDLFVLRFSSSSPGQAAFPIAPTRRILLFPMPSPMYLNKPFICVACECRVAVK